MYRRDTTIRIHIHAETKSTIMMNKHTSLEIYTSHTFIRKGCERVVCERWVGDRTDCNILTPSSSHYSSTSFLILLGCSTGVPEDPSPMLGASSHCLELQLELQLQLTPTNSTLHGTGLYNCLMPTCFLWVSHLHRIQPVHGQGYILISSTGCTSFLIDDWVEGQYVTKHSEKTGDTTVIF